MSESAAIQEAGDEQAISVLVVDDSAFARMGSIMCLKSAGLPKAVYHQAANGREALDFLEQNKVDLLVTDLNMPVMSGLGLIAEIKHREALRDLAVVVVSSEGEGKKKEALLSLGAHVVIAKPITGVIAHKCLSELFVERGWKDGERQVSLSEALSKLEELAPEVLEGMFFEEIEFIDLDKTEFDFKSGDLVWVRVELEKPLHAQMYLAVPKGLLLDLYEQMSTDAELVGDEEAKSLAGEIANALGGRLLLNLTHDDSPTAIGLPEFGIPSKAEKSEGNCRVCDMNEFEFGIVMERA